MNTIRFTKEQSWKIDFATSLPGLEGFGQVIHTAAKVLPAQGDEVLITARTNGVFWIAADPLLEGTTVMANKTIAGIRGNDLAEENSAVAFSKAENEYNKAKANYERSEILVKDRIVSEKDYLEAKITFENAKVVYDNLKNNFTSKGQNIKSPFTGYVKKLFVQNGQYVEKGQQLLTITQNKKLFLQAEVKINDAAIVADACNGNIRTLSDSRTYSFDDLNARITTIGKAANTDNYLIPVNIEIDNNYGFLPGSFVELYLKTCNNSTVLTVPNSALLEEQGNYFVLVQITPELFEKREIKKGATDGMRTVIKQNLSSNERIVTKGGVLVSLAQSSGTLDAHAGHVH